MSYLTSLDAHTSLKHLYDMIYINIEVYYIILLYFYFKYKIFIIHIHMMNLFLKYYPTIF